VCTQDVMKLSLLFDGKRDIEDCRISVCARLIQAGISKESLANEVKEITAYSGVFRTAIPFQIEHPFRR